MTCWSTAEWMETALELVTEGCMALSDGIVMYILSMSVEPVKIILNPILPFCHFV